MSDQNQYPFRMASFSVGHHSAVASVGTCAMRESYRDLEEMMAERGLSVDHTTIYRWVQRYAPELEKRSRPPLKASDDRLSCR